MSKEKALLETPETNVELRDQFAGLAMQALLSNNTINCHHAIALEAYKQADSMLKYR